MSELSLKDLNNFILLEIYKQINWKHLFVYKFSNELYPNFKDFNSNDLYVGMLKELEHKQYYQDFLNIDFGRYVTSNKIFSFQTDVIARTDDIIIYQNTKDELGIFNILDYAIGENSLKLTEYILKSIPKNDHTEDQIRYMVIDNYSKLILKHFPVMLKEMFLSLTNTNVLEYLINTYEFKADIILEAIKRTDYSNNGLLYMKILINNYYDQIKQELPELLRHIIDDNIEKFQRYDIIVYLSNLYIIKKEFNYY